VRFAYENGIIRGDDKGNFNPESETTRAEFVTMLANRLGTGAETYRTSRFSDVPTTAWYFTYVEWAADSGFVSGTGNAKFDPNGSVTRQEITQILYNYFKAAGADVDVTGYELNCVDSGEISAWALSAVKFAYKNGIVSGNEKNEFKPEDNASRAETATMFRNASAILI
jgi:hypothetical protein